MALQYKHGPSFGDATTLAVRIKYIELLQHLEGMVWTSDKWSSGTSLQAPPVVAVLLCCESSVFIKHTAGLFLIRDEEKWDEKSFLVVAAHQAGNFPFPLREK